MTSKLWSNKKRFEHIGIGKWREYFINRSKRGKMRGPMRHVENGVQREEVVFRGERFRGSR